MEPPSPEFSDNCTRDLSIKDAIVEISDNNLAHLVIGVMERELVLREVTRTYKELLNAVVSEAYSKLFFVYNN